MKTSLTHKNPIDIYSKADIKNEFTQIRNRLNQQFKNDEAKSNALMAILDDLNEFELGRFLIKNSGALSGKWTYYIIVQYNNITPKNKTEEFILHKAPTVIATRERFHIFKRVLEESIQSNSVVCSVPCGVMGDLLHLDLPEEVENVSFVGIDFDKTVFDLARDLANNLNIKTSCQFFQKDAWSLDDENAYDVMTTNGLNIYEGNNDRVTQLYKLLQRALKPGGILVGSHVSKPPSEDGSGDWDMSAIDSENLAVQKELFSTILQATWANFRSPKTTETQLLEAGFENIKFIWDSQKIFYTFVAQKP